MAASICPHCNVMSNFKHKSSGGTSSWMNTSGLEAHWSTLRCDSCDGDVVHIYIKNAGDSSATKNISFPSIFGRAEPEVPSTVAADYVSGVNCLNIGEFRASATMFRRSLQNTMIELGAEKSKRLNQQIDDMAAASKFTKEIQEWAHEIRYWGNDGAHPGNDGLSSLTLDDVTAQKEFLEQLFDYVFVMPKRVAEARAKRQSKS